MKFEVPQFIEIEDKIFGPLTLKQFVYLAGGAGLSFVLWITMPTFVALVLIAPVAALSLALAFYKVNNRSFIVMLESVLSYTFGNKLYVWRKREKKVEKKAAEEIIVDDIVSQIHVPRLSESKLKDLSWSLDVKELEVDKGQDDFDDTSKLGNYEFKLGAD